MAGRVIRAAQEIEIWQDVCHPSMWLLSHLSGDELHSVVEDILVGVEEAFSNERLIGPDGVLVHAGLEPFPSRTFGGSMNFNLEVSKEGDEVVVKPVEEGDGFFENEHRRRFVHLQRAKSHGDPLDDIGESARDLVNELDVGRLSERMDGGKLLPAGNGVLGETSKMECQVFVGETKIRNLAVESAKIDLVPESGAYGLPVVRRVLGSRVDEVGVEAGLLAKDPALQSMHGHRDCFKEIAALVENVAEGVVLDDEGDAFDTILLGLSVLVRVSKPLRRRILR